jgi:Ca2+-binding EF-hand superfamily protein
MSRNSRQLGKRRVLSGVCFLLLTTMGGCASSHHSDIPKPPDYMLYSPNGEPLNGGPLGRPTCKEALSHWFDRIDVTHQGSLTHDEFIADAAAQFARMDIDHNGYLLPEELERYRLPYRQDTTDRGTSAADDAPPHKGHHSDESNGSAQNGAPDPVMAADVNNHFRVTLPEFLTQTDRVFQKLDPKHEGAINRDALLKTCTR